MTFSSLHCSCSIAAAILATTWSTAAWTQTPAPAEQRERGQDTATHVATGEIVVTASRREEALQRTPQSISVLNGEAQFLRGQTGLEDIQKSVPNVNFSNVNNTARIFIRGVGNTFINSGGGPGVALYQDGAYVTDQTTSNLILFDVQRVEVLRGPQGALYGRNAVGGSVNIISAKPTSDWSGSIAGTVGSYGRRDTEGYVSGPLGFWSTDVRISYQVRRLGGYIENQLSGQAGAPGRLDDLNSKAIRFQTRTALPGDGTLGVILTHVRQSDSGSALAITPVAGIQYPVELLTGERPTAEPWSVKANVGDNDVRVTTVNANLQQPVGDVTFSVVGNFRNSRRTTLNDCDSTSANNCTFFRDTDTQDYFIDANLASPGDARSRWLVGMTYLDSHQDLFNDIRYSFPLSYIRPGAPSTIPVSFLVNTGGASIRHPSRSTPTSDFD